MSVCLTHNPVDQMVIILQWVGGCLGMETPVTTATTKLLWVIWPNGTAPSLSP